MKISASSEITRNLHRLVFLMDKAAGYHLKLSLGLTFSQYRLLGALRAKKRLTQADIACFYELSPAAVSRQVEILKNKRLIKIERNRANLRQNLITLTAGGEKEVEKAGAIYSKSIREIYSALSGTEMQSLSAMLEKIMDSTQDRSKKYFCN